MHERSNHPATSTARGMAARHLALPASPTADALRFAPFAKLLPIAFVSLVLGAILPACLMPPASVVQSARANAAAADVTPAKNIGDVPAPSKPSGVLISDGTL